MSKFHFFIHRCPVLAPFVDKAISALLYYLCSFAKDQLTIFMWVYFWALCSVPLIYFSVLSPISHCLDCCSFILSLAVEYCHSSDFVLLLQYCMGVLGLLPLHINFRIIFSISRNNLLAGILIGIVLNL